MASRRELIRMTGAEVAGFLAAERTMSVATLGPGGRPHLVPLWFVPGSTLSTWTYGSSQKVANLRRDPRATVLVEAGESYEELRGVSMECDVALVEDEAGVVRIGSALLHRYSGSEEAATAAAQFVRAQAAKRVGLVFTPTRVTSWDHRKLAGTY
ncbi:pyridoxamine 5'-phosphate oxidase family protein [Actinokineospora fastidiosa]|uniref:PPOX class F420-dependent enzyme n=1 Tax=Actinokineospora fastidiosa TaxID=1816 RepID=A0A918G5U5_9PSEU|nr:pyridoxamine 5'-phosphate oxidase family protein [Actinokineospora fastidiosa]GGS20259.1 PPOX class F420-dependent enzyme [Actinokineospora fastidiosa]